MLLLFLLLEACFYCNGLVFAAQSLLFRFFYWNAVWSEGLDKLRLFPAEIILWFHEKYASEPSV